MTENEQGAELWDVVKYDHLDGIVKVPDVQGEFVFDQDTVVAPEDMFTYDWIHSRYDSLIHIMGKTCWIRSFRRTSSTISRSPWTAW